MKGDQDQDNEIMKNFEKQKHCYTSYQKSKKSVRALEPFCFENEGWTTQVDSEVTLQKNKQLPKLQKFLFSKVKITWSFKK